MPRQVTPETPEKVVDPDETEVEESEVEEGEPQAASPSPPTPTPAPKTTTAKTSTSKAQPAGSLRRSSRKTSVRLELLNKAKTPPAGVQKKKRGRPSSAVKLLNQQVTAKKRGPKPKGKKAFAGVEAEAEDDADGEATKPKVKRYNGPKSVKVFNSAYHQYIAEFVVEKVVDSMKSKRSIYYLVKWKGYPKAENTWEPAKNLVNASDELRKFHNAFPNKPYHEK